jgi:hypothetical protein
MFPARSASAGAGALPRTGRFLGFNLQNDPDQLLVTIAQAMGVDQQLVGDRNTPGTSPDVLGYPVSPCSR